MNLTKLSQKWNGFLKFADRNTPHILTAASLFGLFETGVQAFKAGPKVKEIVEFRSDRMKEIETSDWTDNVKKEERWYCNKTSAKQLVLALSPTFLTGAATSACIIGSDHVSAKRIATVSAAYTIADTALKEYKEKVVEVVGDKKARSIGEQITKDRVNKTQPPEDVSKIPVISSGQTVLCKDVYSGRYFYSTAQKIERAVLKLSSECITDMWISLNDLYYELGLEQIPMGNDLGWNADDMVQYQLPISTTAVLTEDKQPCLGVDYDVHLRYDYRNLH